MRVLLPQPCSIPPSTCSQKARAAEYASPRHDRGFSFRGIGIRWTTNWTGLQRRRGRCEPDFSSAWHLSPWGSLLAPPAMTRRRFGPTSVLPRRWAQESHRPQQRPLHRQGSADSNRTSEVMSLAAEVRSYAGSWSCLQKGNWCGRGDSNPHGLSPYGFSYQLRLSPPGPSAPEGSGPVCGLDYPFAVPRMHSAG